VPIGLDDLKLNYIPVSQARQMSGLRMVLGAYPVPGPWREACKGVYYVKGLEYVPVRAANEGASDLGVGADNSQSELIAWTGQASAPVVAWNDELPVSKWYDQLYLAERLQPELALIPDGFEDRVRMFGLAHELLGEQGVCWQRRLLMVDKPLSELAHDDEQRGLWTRLGSKYGYSGEQAAQSITEICSTLHAFQAQLATQKDKGYNYLIGEKLSALDIYWACTCGFLAPMEPERCPMIDDFRDGPYGFINQEIDDAVTPALRAHRDYIYEQHLELPIVF
jgi:glutathione S-transferase